MLLCAIAVWVSGCSGETGPSESVSSGSGATEVEQPSASKGGSDSETSAQAEASKTIPESSTQPSDESTTNLADSESTAEESNSKPSTETPLVFELSDATQGSGVEYQHFAGRTGKHFIIETITCGIATFDYDGDGLVDIYLPNGAPLRGAEITPAPTNRLFKNLGGFRFQDVTEESGAGDLGFAIGVCVGDYDNDGDPDLFVTNFGLTIALENQGDGTFFRREFFSDAEKPRIGAGVALLDFDADGQLDLYVSNYVDFTFDKDVTRLIYGVPGAPGPKDYDHDFDRLLRNDGQGGFEDVTEVSGIGEHRGAGMAIVAFDFDQDWDTDVFVCNDSMANFMFVNQGDGTFIEDALLTSLAYDSSGNGQASMGVDLADVDHDGLIDLVSTNFTQEIPNLYLNAGDGLFDDVGAAMGLGVANQFVSWGVGLVDFDNDMWDDCFIAAGHLIDALTKVNDANKFRAPHSVLHNQNGKFKTASVGGDALDSVQVSRGTAFDDLDNDGNIDAVVLNLNSAPQLIRNTTQNSNHYLHLELIGTQTNRCAVGAKLELTVDGEKQVKEVVRGRGYQSHHGSRLHFGLGTNTQVDSLTIHWSKESKQSFKALPGDKTIIIVEGSDSYSVAPVAN